MMDELLRLADELHRGLQEELSEAIRRSIVQGALLEVDRYWYWSAVKQLASRGQLPRPSIDDPRFHSDLPAWVLAQTTYEPIRLDWTYRPWDWKQHCKAMGHQGGDGEGPDPVIIRVLLRDPAEAWRLVYGESLGVGPFAAGLDRFDLQRLPRSFRYHPIIYELRPSAVSTSMLTTTFDRFRTMIWGPKDRTWPADISIGRADPNTSGTAGGCLWDPRSGRYYVVSCAHVLGLDGTEVYSPGPFEGRDSRPVGRVRYSSIPPRKPFEMACAIDVVPDAGRLDVAVAELYAGAPRANGGPHRVRAIAQIHPFQPVIYGGIVSGTVEAQINALTIWQEFLFHPFEDRPFGASYWDEPKGFRCFGRIFELAGRRGDLAPVAKEGDSGAWVVDEVHGLKSWDGILIGQQGMRAYGCFADRVVESLRGHPEFPDGLALPT
jgi:hypothetical protein